MQRLRFLLVPAILVALLYTLLSPRITRAMPDFEVYWKAAQRAGGGEPLYRATDGHYQFKYLPAFAIVASPLASLTLGSAKALWFALSLLLLCAVVGLSIRILPEQRKATWLLVVAAVVVMGKFFGHELLLGQVNLLFAALVAAALLTLEKRDDWMAGALLSAAIVVKPYGVLFLPWIAAIHRRRALAAVVLGTIAALMLPAFVYGVDGSIELHAQWWRTVSDSTEPNLLNQDNVSLAAMFAKWLGPGLLASRLAALTAAALLIVAGIVLVRRLGLRYPEGLEAALLLTLIPLLSPQGWDYVFLLSTPAVVYLVNYEDTLPLPLRALTIAALAIIGLSLFDVMGRANYAAFMSLSIITLCYFVVIAALAALRLRRIA